MVCRRQVRMTDHGATADARKPTEISNRFKLVLYEIKYVVAKNISDLKSL